MTTQHADQTAELVGLGTFSTTPIKASPDRVWAAMCDKMYHTEKYLPVTDVKTTEKVPDKEVYREMTLNGKVMREMMYFDKSRFEIRIDIVDSDRTHYNVYHPDTGLLEYWEATQSGERVPWNVSKSVVLKAMEKTKEVAEAPE